MVSRSLATSLLLVLFVALAGTGNAYAWGEEERTELPALVGPPAAVPPLPPEAASLGRPNRAGKIPLLTKQTPLAMQVASDGTVYVLAQGEGQRVTGVAIGLPVPWPPTGPPLDEYLYTASLISVYRVSASGGEVQEVTTFLAQNDVALPSRDAREPQDGPAGLALDEAAPGVAGVERRLYVSVPGRGVVIVDPATRGSRPFVNDENNVWVPFDGLDGEDYTGEGSTSPAVIERDARGGATRTLYGTLWKNGPTVPSQIAVDPVTHNVLVAEATSSAGTGERNYYGRYSVREFTPAGTPVGDVNLASTDVPNLSPAQRLEYPAPDGSIDALIDPAPAPGRPGWLLGAFFDASDTLAERVAALRFTSEGSPVILNQVSLVDESFVGQVVRLDRGGRWSPAHVTRAALDLSFTPSEGIGRGVEDLAITKAGNYIVPSTSEEGLIEMTPAGGFLGRIGRATGGTCAFANDRLRMATDPRDGDLLLLQQPAGTEAPVLIRLDPDASGCPRAGGREFTDPEAVVRVAPVTEEENGSVREVGAFRDLGADENEVEVARSTDPGSRNGLALSIVPSDRDNEGADFEASASCTLLQLGITSTFSARANGCRPTWDGGSRSELDSGFRVTGTKLLDSATRAVAVEVSVRDDEGATWGPRTITVRLVGDEPEPLVAQLEAAVSPTSFQQVTFDPRGSSGFRQWRLLFEGTEDGPALPASGYGSDTEFPRSTVLHTYPGPGTYTPVLKLRDGAGNEVSKALTVTIRAPTQQQGTVVESRPGASCVSPLGTPLPLLGLGDENLCVPADPCDIDPAELGLTRQPIIRPASCGGVETSFSGESVETAPPTSARPTFLRRTLRMSRTRRIPVVVRCGSGAGTCSGRVRIQVPASGGRPATTVGAARFSTLRPGARKTVTIVAGRSAAASLQRSRSRSRRVSVTITPTTVPGFTRPRADRATVTLTVPSRPRGR